MNMLRAAAAFLPAVCIGILLVNLFWEESRASAILVKLFLGIGLGIGLNSLFYFLYLLAFAGSHFFLVLQLAILVILLLFTVRFRRRSLQIDLPAIHMTYWQVALLAGVLLAAAFALSSASTVWKHRPSGTWDAYQIYNRTARFVFRSQGEWLQSFSSKLDPVFHADYPLLLPLGVASSWDTLGHESPQVPLLLSGLMMLDCAGLFASALAFSKSVSQAGVGLLILLNTPLFMLTGASQTADVPLAFFILATAVLIYLYASQRSAGLLVLAGLTCGLAGWTKNEGQLLLVVIGASLFLTSLQSRAWARLGYFVLGLLFPLAIITYFKLFLAPPNDLFGGGIGGALRSSIDWQRHLTILDQFWQELIAFGRSWIGVVPLLLVYALIFGAYVRNRSTGAGRIIMLMVVLQLAGYYFVYLITPHPVTWQLEFSLERLLLQVYLPVLFLIFVSLQDIGVVWASTTA